MKTFFKLTLCLVLCLTMHTLNAQVGINTDGSIADNSAMLDVESTTKGMLIPRMTSAQRTAISSPAAGLLVYDTTTDGFWFYDAGWQSLTGSDEVLWEKSGAHIVNKNLATTKVGIGTSPSAKLDVAFNDVAMPSIRGVGGSNIAILGKSSDGAGISGESTNDFGIIGTSANNDGIYGYSSNNDGVYGQSSSGKGIRGLSITDDGVYGFSTDKYGVQGKSQNEHGVYGESNTESGVYGTSTAIAGTLYAAGVYGDSDDVIGVFGLSDDDVGVEGYSDKSYGVCGESHDKDGVYGNTSDSNRYAGYFNGDVYTTAMYQSSARKLKQDEQKLGDALTLIGKLQPKSYAYKTGNYRSLNLPKGRRYGFIADEVEQVLPQLVKAADTELFDLDKYERDRKAAEAAGKDANKVRKEVSEVLEFKAVNYTELIPILVAAVQEQQAEIADLKQLIHNLQND